jgi:hypothetical protein
MKDLLGCGMDLELYYRELDSVTVLKAKLYVVFNHFYAGNVTE